jgi:Flp pilus assembly secretin CpaC
MFLFIVLGDIAMKTVKSLVFISMLSSLFYYTEALANEHNGKEEVHVVKSKHTISGAIHSVLPGENISVHHNGNVVILRGQVSSADVAGKAEKIASEFLGKNGKVLNFTHIKASQQVMLRVKVGEVRQNSFVNYSAHGNDAVSNNFSKLIAEPNLTAISGERAEFLVGGELPVPVVQGHGAVTVNYKPYGVKLGFVPFVISNNRIRLIVDQEVSELGNDGVSVAGYRMPSIVSRKAKTTVEMAPGESMMIAGIVKEKGYGSAGTELVISVTPYLVDPMHNKDVRLPTDNHVPSKLEMRFADSLKKNKTDVNLEGPIGFLAE